jgi:hypothetical protein
MGRGVGKKGYKEYSIHCGVAHLTLLEKVMKHKDREEVQEVRAAFVLSRGRLRREQT